MHKVGLLSLGRKTGRRTTTHNVDDNERQLSHNSQADAFALKSKTRTRSRSHSEVAGKRSTDSRANASDFVFHLASFHAEVFALSQFVKDVGSRSDRVATEEQWASALFRSQNQAPSSGLVTIDVGVNAWFSSVAFDAVGRNRSVYVVSVVVAALYNLGISLVYGRLLSELILKHVQSSFQWAVEQPANQTESKHVAALESSLVVETAISKGSLHHRSHRNFHDLSTNLSKADFVVRSVGGVEGFVEVRLLK